MKSWYALTMKHLLLILILGFMGCGKQYQDEQFGQFVDQFVQDAAARGVQIQVNTQIIFGNPASIAGEADVIGVCLYAPDQGRIIIDRSFWNSAPDEYRKMVIYHELGHCVLGREHNPLTELVVNGTWRAELPMSIMNPSAPSDGEIEAGGPGYEKTLIDELFSKTMPKDTE